MHSPPTATGKQLSADPERARLAIAENRLWYHTMELAPGVVTPGWFDLRPIVERMPWPDVMGLRCLDVGPYDGFLTFELERRGAAEVVAVDIGSPSDWDWPLRLRQRGAGFLREIAGDRTGNGFRIAAELLGSKAERVELSVYDLSPERIGSFDLVVCGSLMLHLRDPVRALEAIAGVCRGRFLSAEQVDALLSITRRRTPAAWTRGGDVSQWWIPNLAAHRRMLEAAGFEIERAVEPYSIPFGPGHTAPGGVAWARRLEQLLVRYLGSGPGLLHSALLARPEQNAASSAPAIRAPRVE